MGFTLNAGLTGRFLASNYLLYFGPILRSEAHEHVKLITLDVNFEKLHLQHACSSVALESGAVPASSLCRQGAD